MAWIHLTPDDLRTSISEDELTKLSSVSIELDDVLQQTLDQASAAFRGAWLAKSYTIDPRPYYTAESYTPFILAFARHLLWARFPMAENYALGESRKVILDKALELLDKPAIGVDPVEAQPTPPGPEPTPTPTSAAKQSSIFVPFQRFPDEPPAVWANKTPWTI